MSVTDTNIEAPGGIPADTPAEPVEAASQEPIEPSEIHKIKVDGQEVEVTLDELRSGYQRQSDYTRKTQELAAERKRLVQAEALVTALDTDPQATLQALNDAYKSQETSQAEWDQMDPQEQRIAKLEQELQTQRARDARHQIENEFRTLESQYGEIDRNEVGRFALRNGLNVVDAYRVMNFDNVRAEREKLAKDAHVLDQKRTPLPHGDGGAQRGAVGAPPARVNSVREAYLEALKQAG